MTHQRSLVAPQVRLVEGQPWRALLQHVSGGQAVPAAMQQDCGRVCGLW